MNPAIEIMHLFAYLGPNIFGPQPGVLLRVHCDQDRSQRLRDAFKDGAQFIGLVLAYLDITTISEDDRVVISVSFTTPTPTLGAELATYVVEGIRAEAGEDTEWDRDTLLFALQKRRRQEALPIAVLQLMADARKRDLPVLSLPTGQIQIGYGTWSWQVDPTLFSSKAEDETDMANGSTPAPLVPPWDQLGYIPIYAVTGERNRKIMVQQVADELQSAGHKVHVLHDADYVTTLALLADPAIHTAVIGLDTAAILRHGVAFTRCTQSIISDMDGAPPIEAATRMEWAQALGVPMLISTAPTLLNMADAEIARLAHYAPHGAIPLNLPDTESHSQSVV